MSDLKTARVMYILNQAFAQLLILLLYTEGGITFYDPENSRPLK